MLTPAGHAPACVTGKVARISAITNAPSLTWIIYPSPPCLETNPRDENPFILLYAIGMTQFPRGPKNSLTLVRDKVEHECRPPMLDHLSADRPDAKKDAHDEKPKDEDGRDDREEDVGGQDRA